MRARVAGEEKVAKKRGPVRESAFSQMRKSQKAWPCARIGVSGDAKASLSAASGRSGLGAGSERGWSGVGAGPIGTATQRFRKD